MCNFTVPHQNLCSIYVFKNIYNFKIFRQGHQYWQCKMKRLCFEQALAGQNTVFKPGLGFEKGGFDLNKPGYPMAK